MKFEADPDSHAVVAVPTPDPRRRRLLLGVGGSLALGSPMALVGCGGGGGDAEADAVASDAEASVVKADVAAVVTRLPAVRRSAVAVRVAFPAAQAALAADARLVTANNRSEIAADGTAGVVAIADAPQMAYVFGADGRLLLMGVCETGVRTAVDSRSTAEALLLLGSEAALQGPSTEIATRRALADAKLDAVVEPVRLAVEAALGRNGIDGDDAALADALKKAVKTLRQRTTVPPAAAKTRPLSVTVSPSGTESGVTVEPTDDFNTVQLRNQFRRRTHYWVKRTGSYDAAGVFTPAAAPLAVDIVDADLDATAALSFDNLVTSVGDKVAQFFADIGWLGAYESGSAVWQPVTGQPVQLPFAPDTASANVFAVRVVGIGATINGTLTADENTALEKILGTTLFEDVLKPFVRTLILPMLSERIAGNWTVEFEKLTSALLLNATVDLTSIAVAGSYFPQTAAALRAGDAKAVFGGFLAEFFSSNTFQALFETALKSYAAATQGNLVATIRDSSGRMVGVNLLANQNLADLKGSLGKLARIIQVIKVATLVGDYTAIAHDWIGSARLTEFSVNTSKATVALTPKPFRVVATAGIKAITVRVTGLDAAVPASSVFVRWTCSGKYGSLYQVTGSGVDDFESPLSSPTQNYIPTGIADDPNDPEVITATAFYRNPATNGRIEMGRARVAVEFIQEFTLEASPKDNPQLPTDIDFQLTAVVNETLPTGATVEWEWVHGGVGSLAAVPADGNPRASAVTFKTGAADGAATATVRATVRLPATATSVARDVRTKAVVVPLRVKKGTRTITFTCGGGVFPCGPTCGVNDYSAFIVPKIAGAIGYSATFSGFGYGPCNRTVSWTGPVADGGGCSFPITHHPFTQGPAAKAWAVWIGFGGPIEGSGKLVATITLPA